MLTIYDVHEPSALIRRDEEKNFSIWIDGFWKYPFPHFSVYDGYSDQWDASKVASFHIKKPYIITRGEDWAEPWIMTESEMQYLGSVLRGPGTYTGTVWEDIIFQWNREHMTDRWFYFPYTFIGKKMDKLTQKMNADYVPISQPMPKWEY